MISLFIILGIIASVILIIVSVKSFKKKDDNFLYVLATFSVVAITSTLIMSWCDMVTSICTEYSIDNQIQMYQEENEKLEKNIDSIAKDYITYEQDTFKDLKPENYESLLYKYPELKANSILTKQIDTLSKNNEEIKKLKNKKFDLAKDKFLVYFGK